MIKYKIIITLLLLAGLDTTNASIEIRGNIINSTQCYPYTHDDYSWDATNFSALWYDLDNNLKTETLKIDNNTISNCDRIVDKDRLSYTSSRVLKKYKVYEIKGKHIKYGLNKNGNVIYNGTHYAIIGWQGLAYVAIKGDVTNISRLVLEQSEKDKKILRVNEVWKIGDGYTLKVKSINQSKKSARLVLKRNNILLYEKTVYQNDTYLYSPNSIPTFVTYLDNVSSDITLKYTWVISKNVVNIKKGNRYNKMIVTSINKTTINLKNFEYIYLERNRSINITNDLKFKTADSNTLRFYPMILYKSPGIYQIRGTVFNDSINEKNVMWNTTNFQGFWYELDNDIGAEELWINKNINSKDRIIDIDKLVYATDRILKRYKVNEWEYKYVKYGLHEDGIVVYNGTHYALIGWKGQKYIALKGRTDIISKLVFEQSERDEKVLSVGDTWKIGDEYELKLTAIDSGVTPRRALLTLSSNDTILDNKIISMGEVYTYITDIAGLTDVPIFVTYIDDIWVGDCSESFIVLKYTWVVSQSFVQIRPGDKYDSLTVVVLGNFLILRNHANISLNRGSDIKILGDIRFKVANNSILRFYPAINYIN